jgi:hypothetical protein
LELPFGVTQLRPLELRQDDILGSCDGKLQSVEVDLNTTTELADAEGAILPNDEVDLPTRLRVDRVEHAS